MEAQLAMNLDPFRTVPNKETIAQKHVCSPIFSIDVFEGKPVIEKTCVICGFYDKTEIKTGFGLNGGKTIAELFCEEK